MRTYYPDYLGMVPRRMFSFFVNAQHVNGKQAKETFKLNITAAFNSKVSTYIHTYG